MKYVNVQNIPSTSITPSFNGAAIDTSNVLYLSAQFITTGSSPTYAAKLQASNDICPPGNLPSSFVPTNWADIASATVSVSVTGVTLIPKQELSYRWVRIVITFSSGTGTVTSNVFGVCV